MITAIVTILILIVVMPSACVLGLKLAWRFTKFLFKNRVKKLEEWLNKNGL